MDGIYKNIEEYNPNKKHKILMVFDDMIVDLLSNKKPNPTVTEFSIRSRILTHAATRRRSDVVTTSLCTSHVPATLHVLLK